MTGAGEVDVDVAEVARLIGEPARAAMLDALMSGVALTAGELARIAKVAPATASGHLSRLREGGLIERVVAGRHRYFRLAAPEVAQVLETLSLVAPRRPVTSLRASRADAALRTARTCYDHLAGHVGVGIYRSLSDDGALRLGADGLELTRTGRDRLGELGVELDPPARRRGFARPCLDFTERRDHLAGYLGAALCTRLLELDWLRRRAVGQRGLRVTARGEAALVEHFGVDVRG